MAAVLKVTDGTDEVSFLDPSTLYITEWRQQIAPELASGEFEDVVEAIRCAWMQTTDDTRDAIIQTLMKLAGKARDFHRMRKLFQWVWLEARTHSESNSRYAVLRDIFPKELDKRHWGPNGPVDLIPLLTREGLWRGIAPNGTPTTGVSATTIYNKQDTDGNNFVTLPDSSAVGDAPGLVIFEMEPGASTSQVQNFIVARKSGTSQSDLDDFVPHLDTLLEADNALLRVADTNAPDDYRLDITTTTTLRWPLTSATRKLSNYAGEYLVYALIDTVNGGGSATLRLRHGQNYVASATIAPSDVGSPATANYLGRVTIPGGIYNPVLSNPLGYDIYLDVTITPTFTVRFFDLWLIPISEGAVFSVRNAALTSGVLVINGDLEAVFEQTTGGVYQQSSSLAPEVGGRYLQYKPGLYNRYYFFWTGLGELAVPNWDASLTVKIIPRFRTLRGKT